MTQEEINDLLERPQPTCASMLDMPKEESPHLAAIADALEHAKAKHPFFADVAVPTHRHFTVLSCELAEVVEAFSRQDYAHTLEELAQCGAVIVRMMEAVQALVDEAAKAGEDAE